MISTKKSFYFCLVCILACNDIEKNMIYKINDTIRSRIMNNKIIKYNLSDSYTDITIIFDENKVTAKSIFVYNFYKDDEILQQFKLEYEEEELVDEICNYIISLGAGNIKLFCIYDPLYRNVSLPEISVSVKRRKYVRKILRKLNELGKENIECYVNYLGYLTMLYSYGDIHNEIFNGEWTITYQLKYNETVIKLELNVKDMGIDEFIRQHMSYFYGNNISGNTYSFVYENLLNMGIIFSNFRNLIEIGNRMKCLKYLIFVNQFEIDGNNIFIEFFLLFNLLKHSSYFNKIIKRSLNDVKSNRYFEFIAILKNLKIISENSYKILYLISDKFDYPIMKIINLYLIDDFSSKIRDFNFIENIKEYLYLLIYFYNFIKEDGCVDLQEVCKIINDVFIKQCIKWKKVDFIKKYHEYAFPTFRSNSFILNLDSEDLSDLIVLLQGDTETEVTTIYAIVEEYFKK